MWDVISGIHNKALGAISWSRGKRKSMEVYLVNKDKMMLTQSMYIKDAPLRHKVDTAPVRECLNNGREISEFYTGYLGQEVVGASMCLPQVGWVLIVEVGASDMLAPLYEMKRNAIMGAVVVAGLIGILLAIFYRSIVVRLRLLSNASSAIARVDLVMLDMIMPRMNGKEALNEIAKTGAAPRVIFTSGYAEDVMKARGVEQTGAEFISKPASPGELLAKVREVLDK